MDVREKLVELLVEFVEVDAWDNGEFIEKDIDFKEIASNLIANSVTVQEWYDFPVSNSQAYKMLGNGWTCEVIAHILKSLKEA